MRRSLSKTVILRNSTGRLRTGQPPKPRRPLPAVPVVPKAPVVPRMTAVAAVGPSPGPRSGGVRLALPRPAVLDRPPPAAPPHDPLARQVGRQILEIVVIVAATALLVAARGAFGMPPEAVCLLVVALAYHRFLALMGVNMAQITVSFALDFWVLESAEQGSFSGFDVASGPGHVFFDCFFYSVLNFSFFGFGDILPLTVPARLVTLMEVILAFFTVIFLLSDFISLKDSLRRERSR